MLRTALPAVAGALLVACALQVALRGLTAPQPAAPAPAASKMISPRFSGTGGGGQTFTVSGREGMADQTDPGLILIDQPVLKITAKGRGDTTMTARTGVYNEAENKLLLRDDVRIDNGAGSSFRSARAVIDTRTGQVSGQSGLTARTRAAEVQARDYTVMDEGDRMVLGGGVRGRINPN